MAGGPPRFDGTVLWDCQAESSGSLEAAIGWAGLGGSPQRMSWFQTPRALSPVPLLTSLSLSPPFLSAAFAREGLFVSMSL